MVIIRYQAKLLASILTAVFVLSDAYKPVVIIHGLWDVRSSLNFMANSIVKYHPGTDIYILDALHGWKSLSPVWFQVKIFHNLLLPLMNNSPGGINLVGYSQGGLIARGILESFNHNVDTFISLSAPQAGQYGDGFLTWLFPDVLREEAYDIFYSKLGQSVSVANFWNDPHHQELYLRYCNFLPKINNIVPELRNESFKNNFLKLRNVILIGGPDDGIISPWQSSHFVFYGENESITPLEEQVFYENDLFGLKTLNENNRLHFYSIAGVHHIDWHNNLTVIKDAILPWLN